MGRGRNSRRAWAGSLPALALALLACAAPASATLSGFEVVGDGSGRSFERTRALSVPCSGTRYTLGGGVRTRPAAPPLALSSAGMKGFGYPFRVAAFEADPFRERWILRGQAFCARWGAGPPPLGEAAKYVKAVTVLRAATPVTGPGDAANIFLPCPTPSTTIGGAPRSPSRVGATTPVSSSRRCAT